MTSREEKKTTHLQHDSRKVSYKRAVASNQNKNVIVINWISLFINLLNLLVDFSST